MSKGNSTARKSAAAVLTVAILALIAAGLWWFGDGYYTLTLDQRVDHPAFRELRPSGTIGYFYGLVGTLLIFANLLYLARKRFARAKLGSLGTWLNIHVVTGLSGTIVIAYHSTFQARSSMAQVAVGSLAVVALTGIVGRYLYRLAHVGDDPVEAALRAIDRHLPAFRAQVGHALATLPLHEIQHHSSLVRVLINIPQWRREGRMRSEAIQLIVDNEPGLAASDELRRAGRWLVAAVAGESRMVAARATLGAWRPLHRFFAILMLLVVVIHIAVAWHYGYRWIFSE